MDCLLTDLVRSGKPRLALNLYHKQFAKRALPLHIPAFLALLKACTQLKDLQSGCHIHADIVRNQVLSLDGRDEVFLGNKLVDMYAKCGSLEKSQQVFDMLLIRDVVSWNALLAAYTSHDCHKGALISLELMQLEGVCLNPVTFVYILKACNGLGDVEKGGKIHSEIARKGLLEKDLVIGNAILDMYAKFGFPMKAQEVFDVLQIRDVVSWTVVIAGYADCKQGTEALYLFNRMQLEGISPNDHTFVCCLKACASIGEKEKGKAMHAMISREGRIEQNLLLGNALIDMYGKCGLLAKAQEVFDGLPTKDVISWNALIVGYAKHGHGEEALSCLGKMMHEGVSPNAFTYVSSLKACTSIGAIQKIRELHDEIIKKGLLERDVLVSNALIDMYGKSGSLVDAQKVFDTVPFRDVVSWTALMDGYTRHLYPEEALNCFDHMKYEGFSPTVVTYICSLNACGMAQNIEKGCQIHADIEEKGILASDIEVGNAVIEMYIKCGLLTKAKEVLLKFPVRNSISWNAMIIGYVIQKDNAEALESFDEMQHDGVVPNAVTFAYVLKACGSIRAIDKGREVHAMFVQEGLLESHLILGNSLVYMYTKCGFFKEAQEVVNEICARDVASWTAMIAGYGEYDQAEEALKCFDVMTDDGMCPNVITYSCILKACSSTGNIDKGMQIHSEIARKCMLEKDLIIGNALVDMYSKCGSLSKAKEAFDKLLVRDAISWNILIFGYTMHDHGKEALMCFEQMQREGVSLTTFTYVSALKACGISLDTEKGKEIHSQITRKGLLETDDLVGNMLVDMYGRCGSLAEAQVVFDKLLVHDVISWTALIVGYVKCQSCEKALNLYKRMQLEGVCPNTVTYICVLKACSSSRTLEKGLEIHAQIDPNMLLRDNAIGNSLMDVYARCGSLARARQVFHRCHIRDMVSWNILMVGYADHGYYEEVLNCYNQMQSEGVVRTSASFICGLKACGSIQAINKGKELHEEIIEKQMLQSNVSVGNALISMYIQCGLLLEAWKTFDKLPVRNRLTWITLISGYVKYKFLDGALNLCQYMLIEETSTEESRDTSNCFSRCEFIDSEDLVTSSMLVNVYAECGLLAEAQEVFDRIPVRDVVLWTSLMAGYVKHEWLEEALDCYEQMQVEGISPDTVTFLCSLKTCGSIGIGNKGREIHAEIIRQGISDKELIIGNALIDMYAKCGIVSKAVEVFEKLQVRDVISWTALISGYVQTGECDKVFSTFERMRCDGVQPDLVTFASVLTACCRLNLVDNGHMYFEAMDRDFGIKPNLEHYTSVVDLLVQSGNFAQAMSFVKQMPMYPDTALWNTMMSACLKSGNLELGKEVFQCAARVHEEKLE